MSSIDRLEGRTLGDFVLREKVGEGQFGSVYRADQPVLERQAVVKILRENHRSSQPTIQRFMREARLAARLDHPYAAHIYAFGAEPDGVLWIAMELVRGTPLEQVLSLQGPMPLSRLVPLLEKLCEVIATAHEQGIVHRDVKPANVMVVARGGRLWPKLLDFGVAKLVEDKPDEERVRMGSPAYLAPELWRDSSAADARSDLYALGVLAYQALTGKLPFAGSSLAAVARAHAERPLPQLGNVAPEAVHAVLARATAKKPAERYATVVEFAAALRTAAGLDEARANVPMLDEAVRTAWMHDAPQPLAEAVAALEAAATLPQAAEAIGRVVRVVAHWLGIVALACRSLEGAVADDDGMAPLLQAMRRRALGDEEWLELARQACRAFAARREAFVMPELVALVCPDDGAAPFGDELLALRAATLAAAAATPDEARARLTACMTQLASLLGRLGFVAEYALVVPRAGRAEAERWMGVRRTPRPTRAVRGETADGEALLIARDGHVVARLSPLVQVAPPAPGAADEMFFLEGSGRHGAKLVAIPFGFERHDERPWDWLRQTFTSSDPLDDVAGDGRAPYRGLSAFTPADADVFFGREREAVAFANRLRTQPLVAVVGASGAGKSSFVQAGVIPTLPEAVRVVTARPGARPTAALVSRLRAEGWLGDAEPADDAGLVDELRARATSRGHTLLVVVDQFEELFTLGADADERMRYANLLVRLARAPDDPIRVVVTLRDDFLMRAQALPPLRAYLASGLELLATPSPADLLRIIVEPARRAGYAFEPADLPLEIVQAVAHEPGALALVSFTASKMWELRDADHHLLPRRAYDALGGVGGALAQHAEETLARMPADHAGLVREAFRHLVTADGTRAVLTRRDLEQLIGGGPAAQAAIEELVATRLLVTSEGVEGGELVEVVHEALLSAWPRLVDWRREDADGARLRDQVRAAARQWVDRGRSRGLLWRDEALVELKLWRARHALPLTENEQAFVTASFREAARGRRLRMLAVAAAFVALAGGLAVVRLQRVRAEAEAHRARLRLGEQYEEEARQAFVGGAATRALVYLQEAQQLGVDDAARRFLFAAAAEATSVARGALRGHAASVRTAAFSPDGRRVVTASDDKTAVVWDTAGAHPLVTLRGHAAGVAEALFSPDGTRVATAGWDNSARLYDAASGALLHTFAGHGGSVTALAFSSDGTRVITACKDGVARIFDTGSGALAVVLTGHTDRVRQAVFSPDGTRVVTAADDNSARIWDARTGRALYTLPHRRLVAGAAFSPDGSRIATGSDDTSTRIFRAADGKLLHELEGHTDFVRSVAFSDDGTRLVSASWDNSARVWDVESGKLVAVLEHRSGMVATARFSPDGRRVVTAGGDGTAKLWDARSGGLLAVLEGHQSSVSTAVFSSDGALVLTGSSDQTARLWDAQAGAPEVSFAVAEPNGARFSPDGRHLAVAAVDGHARIYDLGGTLEREISAHTAALTAAMWTADGARLATSSEDKTAALFDAASGAALQRFTGHTGAVMYVAISSDGRRVATASEDNTARVWNAATGATELILKQHADNVSGVAFSPDGTLVATSSWDKSVRLWDARSGALVRTIGGHPTSLQNVSFSPDGRRLLVGQDNGTGSVYDVATGTLAGVLVGHVGMLEQAAFSADGALIATVGNDRTSRVWDAQTFRLLQVHAGPAKFLDDVCFNRAGTQLATASGDGVVRIYGVPRWRGDAAEAAALVKARAPFRLDGGKLVAATAR